MRCVEGNKVRSDQIWCIHLSFLNQSVISPDQLLLGNQLILQLVPTNLAYHHAKSCEVASIRFQENKQNVNIGKKLGDQLWCIHLILHWKISIHKQLKPKLLLQSLWVDPTYNLDSAESEFITLQYTGQHEVWCLLRLSCISDLTGFFFIFLE